MTLCKGAVLVTRNSFAKNDFSANSASSAVNSILVIQLCQQMIRPEMVSYLVSSILEKKGEFCPREFLGEGVEKIASRQYVQVYRSEIDQWGVKFLPLIPRYLEIEDLIAGVYREVGRKLIYPAYRIHPETLIHEFSSFYRGITPEGREKMDEILRNLEMARSLCEEGTDRFSGLSGKIGEILGSLEVLAPLCGFFQDLRDGTGRDSGKNISSKNPCEATLAPLKICIDLLTHIYRLPRNKKEITSPLRDCVAIRHARPAPVPLGAGYRARVGGHPGK